MSNWLNLHAIKQQLFMIIISPASGRWLGSARRFCLPPLRQLQAGGGWAVRLRTGWSQLENSFTHMPGAWTRRIQIVVGWSGWVSLSFHLSNTVTWGGQTSQMRLRAPKLCYPTWRVMQGNFHHILSFRGESLESQPIFEGGELVSVSQQEERQIICKLVLNPPRNNNKHFASLPYLITKLLVQSRHYLHSPMEESDTQVGSDRTWIQTHICLNPQHNPILSSTAP